MTEIEVLADTVPDIEALARVNFEEDKSAANGSSIAFLAEYEDTRILFCADAHPRVLRDSIDRLRGDKRLPLTACKLPHHGSKYNVSPSFLKTLDCKKYIFSTNGSHFGHPDQEAVARVIKLGGENPELIFNYRSDFTKIWDNKKLKKDFGYSVTYPPDGQDGITVEFS